MTLSISPDLCVKWMTHNVPEQLHILPQWPDINFIYRNMWGELKHRVEKYRVRNKGENGIREE